MKAKVLEVWWYIREIMNITKEIKCHGGILKYIEHESKVNSCKMEFTIFVPKNINNKKSPALFYLSGLTCSAENFTTKANAYKKAAKLGIIIIAPDTSPRGNEVPDDEAYDLGQGAGFYINATNEPWYKNYNMEDYIAKELYNLILENFLVDKEKIGLFGHSMGGHGALTLYLKYPEIFKSVSAFSPICSPLYCDWGEKAFSAYFGDDKNLWRNSDSSYLMENSELSKRSEILIDQGTNDQFLDNQLKPEIFRAACNKVNHPLNLRYQDGYDHSYFFIQTFIDDHLEHHAEILS